MRLLLADLRLDGGTQPRASILWTLVEEYAEHYKCGVRLPPIVVFYDGSDYWVVDGFHRVNGAQSAGLKEIEADVHQGDREDAVWFSLSVNQSHGLRRTNADKRRAVETAMRHPKSKGLSDRAIAEHCGVSNNFVSELRKSQVSSDDTSQPRTGRDGKQYKPHSEKRKAAAAANKRADRRTETGDDRPPSPTPSTPQPRQPPRPSYDDVASAAMRLVAMALTLTVDQQDSIVRLISGRIGSQATERAA